MKNPGFSPPVIKIFSDKKPGFLKFIFTVKMIFWGEKTDKRGKKIKKAGP
ncbi:Uncharacterized protein dnm_038140 [Desulfonema magnum]|uniref:Uncharacterized protein n=1 Tax=Desulfonema magnum TaxID=45655 RepID=A0A975GNH6_9BACT|nr:Uncharacterized protein dnm_038140 [Desulfonema magnum]